METEKSTVVETVYPSEGTQAAEAYDAMKKRNYRRAVELAKPLALNGAEREKLAIGSMYTLGGGGLERDYEKARYWFEYALKEHHSIRARVHLAHMYWDGEGVEVDYKKALSYLDPLIEYNEPVSLARYGTAYQLGWGVEIDIRQAEDYFRRAIKKGLIYPRENLSYIELTRGHILRCLWLYFSKKALTFYYRRFHPDSPRLWVW